MAVGLHVVEDLQLTLHTFLSGQQVALRLKLAMSLYNFGLEFFLLPVLVTSNESIAETGHYRPGTLGLHPVSNPKVLVKQ